MLWHRAIKPPGFDRDVQIQKGARVAQIERGKRFDLAQPLSQRVAVQIQAFGRLLRIAARIQVGFERVDKVCVVARVVLGQETDDLVERILGPDSGGRCRSQYNTPRASKETTPPSLGCKTAPMSRASRPARSFPIVDSEFQRPGPRR